MALTVQRTKFGPVDIVGIDKTDSLDMFVILRVMCVCDIVKFVCV